MTLSLEQKDLIVVAQRRVKSAIGEYQFESTSPGIKALRLAEAMDSLLQMADFIKEELNSDAQSALELTKEASGAFHAYVEQSASTKG